MKSIEDYAVPTYEETSIADECRCFILGKIRFSPGNDQRTWLETLVDEIQAHLQSRYQLVLMDGRSHLTCNELMGIIARNLEKRDSKQ